MNWELTVTKDKKIIASKAGQLTDDKFAALVTDPAAKTARVSISVGEALDYGALKVSATVSLDCDQNEPTINKAGELAFYKALELMKDGFSIYGS